MSSSESGDAAGLLICIWDGADEIDREQLPEAARTVSAPTDLDALGALRWAFERSEGPVVLLRAGTALPAYWWPRLHRGLEIDPATAVSPLDAGDSLLTPWLEPGAVIDLAIEDADRRVFLSSDRAFFPQRAVSPNLSLWRRPPAGLHAVESWPELARTGLRLLTCDHLLVQGPEKPAPPTENLLDPLRQRLRGGLGDPLPKGCAYPGLDDRPAVLHVMHSWGGGVARWTEDFSHALDDRNHLVLIAEGDSEGRDCGRRLVLRAGIDGPELGRWTLPDSIRSTAEAHPEYARVLEQVIDRWCIDQLVISSLIGHSLDALRCELPTLVVFHDFYPSWPRLDVAFEADERPFDEHRLRSEPAPGDRLGHLTPQRWSSLRTAYQQALDSPYIRCAAPSRAVIDNLRRLDRRFEGRRIALIPHAHRPLKTDYRYERGRGDRLRLVVPGRISTVKGKQLLLDALDELSEVADLYLLGAGSDGEDFFGRSGVHIVLDYQRDRLGELLQAVRPDAGLLPSLASETFSYTLSELWSLGIPVLASRRGALAERITHGADGWLFEPTPEQLVETVKGLDRDMLERAAGKIRGKRLGGLTEMAAAYRKLLPTDITHRYGGKTVDLSALSTAHQARELIDALRRNRQQAALIKSQTDELARRGSWGYDLDRKLAERTRWAKSLEQDLEQARERVDELKAEVARVNRELEERTEWARRLDRELEATRDTLNHRITQLEEQYQLLADRHQQVITSRSWRLTRPLRFAARLARRIRDALRFRASRAGTLGRRTQHSLRTRGVRGTALRIGREFRSKSGPRTQVSAPEPAVEFRPLDFPTAEAPRVSIVIPVHNHFEHTYGCLRSLLKAGTEVAFEVVVVDDASSDETPERMPEIAGIKSLRNDANMGFIGTCNRGAEAADGEFLVFLNNDTAVGDRWLDALLETFESHADAGLVGAKLVYPDGRLQEAGGIVFADGSGWNYGRFDDPDHPAYNFVREVDYCSGAAIAIRAELFAELGGFDTRYAPAYYEDTDLAFVVRERGLKVYYQPEAVVTHFEGVTSGTDTGSGIKRYQVINQKKFVDKWGHALEHQPLPGSPIPRAREHGHRKRALIIDACTPTPDQDSGSLRLVNLMQILRELGHQVTFFADNRAYEEGYTEALRRRGVEVYHHPWVDRSSRIFEDIGPELDVVMISRHYIAKNYIDRIRRYCPGARLLFDTVDLHYLRELRLAELEDDAELSAAAARTRSEELAVARRSDVTLVVSPHEREVLAEEAPELNVAVVSNVHRVHGRRKDFGDRRDIMFVGGFQHPPNIDAAQWFSREVLPRIRAELPELVFHIIGSKATPEVRKLDRIDGVEFHGFVPDIEPFFDGCRLAVAPLRYGAGVKGKVNSSMSYGQPVVATSPAVEGMFVRPGEDVMVADAPEAFARAVVDAYTDEALWTRLSEGGIENVRRYFSFEAAKRALWEILDKDESSTARSAVP